MIFNPEESNDGRDRDHDHVSNRTSPAVNEIGVVWCTSLLKKQAQLDSENFWRHFEQVVVASTKTHEELICVFKVLCEVLSRDAVVTNRIAQGQTQTESLMAGSTNDMRLSQEERVLACSEVLQKTLGFKFDADETEICADSVFLSSKHSRDSLDKQLQIIREGMTIQKKHIASLTATMVLNSSNNAADKVKQQLNRQMITRTLSVNDHPLIPKSLITVVHSIYKLLESQRNEEASNCSGDGTTSTLFGTTTDSSQTSSSSSSGKGSSPKLLSESNNTVTAGAAVATGAEEESNICSIMMMRARSTYWIDRLLKNKYCQDPLGVLGLSSATCNEDQIKKLKKMLALATHPDKISGGDTNQIANAGDAFEVGQRFCQDALRMMEMPQFIQFKSQTAVASPIGHGCFKFGSARGLKDIKRDEFLFQRIDYYKQGGSNNAGSSSNRLFWMDCKFKNSALLCSVCGFDMQQCKNISLYFSLPGFTNGPSVSAGPGPGTQSHHKAPRIYPRICHVVNLQLKKQKQDTTTSWYGEYIFGTGQGFLLFPFPIEHQYSVGISANKSHIIDWQSVTTSVRSNAWSSAFEACDRKAMLKTLEQSTKQEKTSIEIEIPSVDQNGVQYREALIQAFTRMCSPVIIDMTTTTTTASDTSISDENSAPPSSNTTTATSTSMGLCPVKSGFLYSLDS